MSYKRELVVNSVVFAGASLLVAIMGYVFNAMAGRVLGPGEYGEIATINSYALIGSAPVLAVSALLIKLVNDSRLSGNKADRLWAVSVGFKTLARKYWYLVVTAGLLLVGLGRLTLLSYSVSLALPVVVFLTIVGVLYVSLLQSVKSFRLVSVIIVLAAGVKVSGPVIASFVDEYRLEAIIFLLGLSLLIQFLLVYYRGVVKYFNADTRPPSIKLKRLLTESWVWVPVMSIVGLIMLNNVDIVLAKIVLSPIQAGYYGMWALFGKLIAYLSIPVTMVLYVLFTEKRGRRLSLEYLLAYAAGLLLFGAGMYMVYRYLGEWIILTLVGVEFGQMADYLPLAAVFGTVYSLVYLVTYYLVASGSRYSLAVPGFVGLMMATIVYWGTSVENIAQIVIGYNLVLLVVLARGVGRVYMAVDED